MGKDKTDITRIADDKMRYVTFEKRKRGFLKKAIELSLMCDKQMLIFIYDNVSNKLVHYQSHSDFTLGSVETCQDNLALQIETYDNANYEMMEKQRITIDNKNRQKQLDKLQDALADINAYQYQLQKILGRKRQAPTSTEELKKSTELKKSIIKSKPDSMLKLDDYFMNDGALAPLKPIIDQYEGDVVCPEPEPLLKVPSQKQVSFHKEKALMESAFIAHKA